MKDVEQVLLSKASIDELIKMKIEEEFISQKPVKSSPPKVVTELKDVPRDVIFSKNSVFKVYNRKNKTQTFINGIQADSMLGLQHNVRAKILDKTLTAFSTEDVFVKFEKATVKDA